jgi:hypothetical protein
MSWGLDVLELDTDADERAIKRAYAKRLRVTRPDDDPVAFQQLHEAYQAALEWVRAEPMANNDEWAEAEAGGALEASVFTAQQPMSAAHEYSPPHPPQGAPVLLRAQPPMELEGAVDVPANAQRILCEARLSPADAFGPWLDATPILWSLRYKPLVGHALLDELVRGKDAICAANMELLVRCFGWDDVHDGVDPDRLEAIRARTHRRWAVQSGDPTQINAALHREGSLQMAQATAERCLRYLSKPWHAGWALWRAVLPDHVTDINRMMDALEQSGFEQLPSYWDPRQVAFWRSLVDVSQVNRWRCLLGMLRGILIGALAAMLPLPFTFIALLDGLDRDMSEYGLAAIGICTAFALIGVLWPLLRWSVRQLTLDHSHTRFGLLLTLPAPLMAIASLVLIHGLGQRVEGTLMIFPALALATARWWRRVGYRIDFRIRYAVFLMLALFIAEAGAVLVLGYWLWEFAQDRRSRAETARR